MNRKLIAALLACILLLGCTGCSLFSTTYTSQKEFRGNGALTLDEDLLVVQNYAELRRTVFNMVNTHEEEIRMLFSGYTGNVVSDLASVCSAVNTESAYGAYCVDYVTYDLTQIVSYYEATINIAYRLGPEESQDMENANNLQEFGELLSAALKEEQEQLVVKVNNGSGDDKAVNAFMRQTLRNHPMAISYVPGMQLVIYSGSSSQKIYQVNMIYDEELPNQKRLKDMQQSVNQLIQGVSSSENAETVRELAHKLYDHIPEYGEGNTAYDALVTAVADSEGIATGFKALCDAVHVPCIVVSGLINKQPHFWNIVQLGKDYYHVDVSLMDQLGERALFMNDLEKQVDCWWNQADYPDCEGAPILLQEAETAAALRH